MEDPTGTGGYKQFSRGVYADGEVDVSTKDATKSGRLFKKSHEREVSKPRIK